MEALGSGTLALTGTNTGYGGVITIVGPTLQVGSNACLGTSKQTITFNGGALQATSGITVPDQIVLDQGGGVVDASGYGVELDGQISGSGGLTVIDSSGGGTLTVTCANNCYTGGTNLGSGTMAIGADGAGRGEQSAGLQRGHAPGGERIRVRRLAVNHHARRPEPGGRH